LTTTTTAMAMDRGDRGTGSGSAVAAEVVKVLRDVGEGTQTTGVMNETRSRAESVANSAWEEVAELNRGLRRASRARGEVANKMAVHALAPHSLKALIDCGKTLGNIQWGAVEKELRRGARSVRSRLGHVYHARRDASGVVEGR
jgi:hypothetical protein